MIDRFLFRPIPPTLYAWLRIALGLIMVCEFVGYFPYLEFFYGDDGFYHRDAVRFLGEPLLPSLFWIPGMDSGGALMAGYLALLVAGTAYCLGLFTPLSGPLLWILWISFFQRNPHSSYAGPAVAGNLLFLLLFAPTGRALSLDRLLARKKDAPASTWPLILRLIRFQICVIYVMSGFYKAMGRTWMDGTAVLYPLLNPNWRRFELEWLWRDPTVVNIFSVITRLTLAWELLFPLLILFPRTRILALLFGVFLHGAQILTIETASIGFLMLASYLAFLDPEWVAARRILPGRTS